MTVTETRLALVEALKDMRALIDRVAPEYSESTVSANADFLIAAHQSADPQSGPYFAPVGAFLERLVAELERRGTEHDYIQACYARGTGGFSEDILIQWLADRLAATQPQSNGE